MKYWIIITLSSLSFLAEAQKVNMGLANGLLEKEIGFYFAVSDSERIAILMDKASLYRANGEYEKALTELDRTQPFSLADDSRVKYERLINYFLLNRFSQAAALKLSEAELASLHRDKEYRAMRLHSLNENGQWELCKSELLNACKNCDSLEIKQIMSLPIIFEFVSPLKCRIMSDIVPGLGMVKAGKPMKGATSFLIQTGLLAGTVYCFYSGYYATGVVSGMLPLLKFHKGGNRLSGILAEAKNDREEDRVKVLYREEIKKVVSR